MISSYNSRIKPPMIGGFHTHFIYSVVSAGIFIWLAFVTFGNIPVQLFMAALGLASLGYAIYVAKNSSDWLMLNVKRHSSFESEAPLIEIDN